MRTSTCLLPKVCLLSAIALALTIGLIRPTHAQDEGVVPASYNSGSFFNQQLGTALRFNYHTRGYGTQDGVVSLGAMKVFNMDDAAVFIDGQGTLSDDFGGGYNVGVGYRQLTTSGLSIDPQRVLGAGFWTDGQSTAADSFFTQLGFSLESLGESFDLRVNGHFPLERTKNSDPVLTGSGTPFFAGNNIFGATETFTVDTAHNVVDGEFAKRISDLEAWAFIGGYQLGGGGVDATGYRLGMRGYAVPDLALSLQVTDDDVYATNVLFGVTWFIGRTNRCNGPCGTILDRFREPVVRNDFIAITSRQASQASGNALTETGTSDAIRIVHVDSSAADGGDGSFESPFNQISDVDASNVANSMEGDDIFVHAGSTFVGADGIAAFQDNQSILGEGVDQNGNTIPHLVDTNELGLINLPETAPGSQSMARPTIDGAGLDVFTLADNNTVNNFTIDNAATAIVAGPDDLGTDPLDTLATPTLQNLLLNDPNTPATSVMTGIMLDRISGTALVENTVEINGATVAAVDVDGGEDGMTIAATINDTAGRSLDIRGRNGGTINFTGLIDDDATVPGNTSLGVLIGFDPNQAPGNGNVGNTDATVNITTTQDIRVASGANAMEINSNTNTTVNVGGMVDLTAEGTGNGLVVDGNSDDTTVTFTDLNATAANGDTVSIDDGGSVTISSATATPARAIANTGTGRALFNSGGPTGGDNNAVVTINSNVTNSGGGVAVQIEDRAENDVTINGTVTIDDMASGGVRVQNNEAGNIIFTNTLTLDTGTSNAVVLFNNDNLAQTSTATISFTDLDIDTTTGSAFTATAGGNLIVTSTNGTNDINVNGAGNGLTLTGITIDPADVTFDAITVTGGGTGIDLRDLDGTGQVVIGGGTNAGDGGTLTTTGTAINVDNVADVAMTNITVANVGGAAGVTVSGQQAGSSATFIGLDVTTADANAVDINNNDDGAITFSSIAATTTGTGNGIDINNGNASSSTVTVNSATINANGTGDGFAATSGGVISMGGTNQITATNAAATAFAVNDVENLSASNVTIDNSATTAAGVSVTGQNTNSDSVTLSNFNVTTSTADAVTVAGNTAGTVILNGLTAESTDGDTVVVQNNTGSTVSINGMTATSTGAGNAFSATGGGTLVATGSNNVTANTGQGVNIDGMTIDTGNVSFASVNVTAGTAPGIRLNSLTGGTVTVSGGNVTTTAGTAASVSDVERAVLNNLTINAAGNAVDIAHSVATDSDISFSNLTVSNGLQGVNVAANGAGEFDISINNANITGVTAEGIAFDTEANADRVDFTLTNSTITVGDQNGLLATLDDSDTADVRFVIDNNDISNASGTADSDLAALDISVGSGMTASVRVGSLYAGEDPPAGTIGDNNVLTNSSVDGDPLRISIADGGAGGTLNLDLRDNTVQSGTVQFLLTQTSGTFNLVDSVDTLAPNNANNDGTVTGVGVINQISPPILAPTP